jgi:molybdopterin synthase catalytic subunit
MVRCEVRIETGDFSVPDEYQAVRERLGGRAGAVTSFVGLVRDVRDEPEGGLRALHLEHYPGMTERSIEDIVRRAGERWRLLDVVVVHRVGDLGPGEQIVFVQAASAHRADAFAACEFIMDYLKTDAVLWKREDLNERSRWIAATADDRARVSGWHRDET